MQAEYSLVASVRYSSATAPPFRVSSELRAPRAEPLAFAHFVMSAAPFDRQQATPLLLTPTHGSDPSSSDFLLLTTHHSAPAFSQLPRPRFLPVLQLAAVTDLLWTLM